MDMRNIVCSLDQKIHNLDLRFDEFEDKLIFGPTGEVVNDREDLTPKKHQALVDQLLKRITDVESLRKVDMQACLQKVQSVENKGNVVNEKMTMMENTLNQYYQMIETLRTDYMKQNLLNSTQRSQMVQELNDIKENFIGKLDDFEVTVL